MQWNLFSDDEVSLILSAIANGQDLCCGDEGMINRDTICPRDATKREMIAAWAYDALGCVGDGDAEHARSQAYLAKARNSYALAEIVEAHPDDAIAATSGTIGATLPAAHGSFDPSQSTADVSVLS